MTCDDLELLELAAKAAGFKKYISDYLGSRSIVLYDDEVYSEIKERSVSVEKIKNWNPYTDNGDALQLAVRLGMKLSTNLHHRFVMVNDEQEFYDESKFGGVSDPEGAMRRAIVRAAAEIGRRMK